MTTILEQLKNKILIFDGATGTEIQKRISNTGTTPEILNITAPSVIKEIHESYVLAGADIITANTFGANRYKFRNSKYTVSEVIKKGIGLTKSFSNTYSALDIGPVGTILNNDSIYDFDYFYDTFKEQILCGKEAGCDLILIETMTDIYEAKAAILAAKENCDLPVFCTMTLQENGRTLTGSDIVTIVSILESLGVDAIGLNCSFGPNEMLPFIEEMVKYSSTNIIIQPNAGLPKMMNGKLYYDSTPIDFLDSFKKIRNLGVNILGGCCGTTPEHISILKKHFNNIKPSELIEKDYTFISSSTKTVIVDQIRIIGERINPTGKYLLKKAVTENNLDYIVKIAKQQESEGADILDVNVGIPGIDELNTMISLLNELSKHTNLPLQIDSSDFNVITNTLRKYNGKAIVNSVNGKKESLAKILPVIKKYGACIVGLTLDENGIPSKNPERFEIAKKIIEKANSFGIPNKNIFIDCLALTASAQQEDVFETLLCINRIKKELNIKTCLGISNVSFGLPEREIINAAFLASALTMGLDMPIMNSNSTKSMDVIRAFKVLKNIDKDSKLYIKQYGELAIDNMNIKKNIVEHDLIDAIVNSMKSDSILIVKDLLKSMSPIKIINDYIAPALDIVGEKYETGEIFLPQLLNSSETVQNIFEIIKKNEPSNNELTDKKKILLATVEGDVHDIGKNIVKMLLENYGFIVMDLGKDVSIEEIVNKVKSENIKLVGLSALMTTTVVNMKKTIEVIKLELPTVKIMVGGAVLNYEYAKIINADFYGKDALSAVAIAKDFFKIK